MKLQSCLFFSVLLLLTACNGQPGVEPADIVLLNGGVYTVDAERRWAEAVAVRDGEIVFVGSNDSVATYAKKRGRKKGVEPNKLL